MCFLFVMLFWKTAKTNWLGFGNAICGMNVNNDIELILVYYAISSWSPCALLLAKREGHICI